jgi:hypothetical protein
VPFGAIYSAYNTTQTSYLWSREFWGAVTAPSFRGLRKFVSILFVPFSILLTAMVGPSSAIAMQPALGNFSVPDILVSLNITSDTMYPDTFYQPGVLLSETPDEGRSVLEGHKFTGKDLFFAEKHGRNRIISSNGMAEPPKSARVDQDFDLASITEYGLQPIIDSYVMPKLYTV